MNEFSCSHEGVRLSVYSVLKKNRFLKNLILNLQKVKKKTELNKEVEMLRRGESTKVIKIL